MDLLRLSPALLASGAAVRRSDPVPRKARARRGVLCLASRRKGFGPEPSKKGAASKAPKEELPASSQPRKSLAGQPMGRTKQAPGIGSDFERKFSSTLSDRQFMEKLEAVKRSALEQKKAEESRATQAIDYDAPIEAERKEIGFGTKVGAGIAVVVFGLVFAFGDFLPSRSVNSNDGAQIVEKTLSAEEKATLEARLQDLEATLRTSPNDPLAIEGAAVTSAELGEYKQATDLLERLVEEKPEDPEAYRLLGDVKYKLKDFEGSARAYRSSLSAFGSLNFEALRGLTNALLAAEKPNEAVQVLLKAAEDINSLSVKDSKNSLDSNSNLDKDTDKIDPVQVQLLLGKAYSDWGHVGDAVSVYDQLISSYPDDFRGYLAKGIILKENGKFGDAERMFIQARFFAPEKAKVLVDRYSRRYR